MDNSIWFDEKNTKQAVAVCSKCPVQQQCAADGAGQVYGVWGGLTPVDRFGVCATKKNRNGDDRTGTLSGYNSHIYAKEEPCVLCLQAHNDYRKHLRDEKNP